MGLCSVMPSHHRCSPFRLPAAMLY